MDIEQIKQDKIKEAVEIFLHLGLDPKKDSRDHSGHIDHLPNQPNIREYQDKKPKLMWTRLSSNSNLGCIIE